MVRQKILIYCRVKYLDPRCPSVYLNHSRVKVPSISFIFCCLGFLGLYELLFIAEGKQCWKIYRYLNRCAYVWEVFWITFYVEWTSLYFIDDRYFLLWFRLLILILFNLINATLTTGTRIYLILQSHNKI